MEKFTRGKAVLYSGIAEQKRMNLKRCIAEAEKAEASQRSDLIDEATRRLKAAAGLADKAYTVKLDGELPEPIAVSAGGRKSAEFAPRETPPCDGILLSVEYEGRRDEATLTVGVGNDDGFSYAEDIPLPVEGEKIWLSYDLLSPVPAGAERIVVALNSDEDIDVRVTAEEFFRELPEKDERMVYSETPAEKIENTKFYKIRDVSNGRALALVPCIKERDLRWKQSLIHTDKGQHLALLENANDYVQQWQLYKTEYGKYHIVNKSNANHLQLDENRKAFPADVDMNCDAQDFDVLPAGPGKFLIRGVGGASLSCENSKSGIWRISECAYDDWVMTFDEEFEGDELNRKNWGVCNRKTRPATEPISFRDRPENFRVKDSNLIIRTSDDGDGIYPLTGAYLDTRGLYGITYGKMEMSARLATGAWIWPAFWSMGIVGNWPYQGEIDVMELIGGGKNGELDSKLFGTLHWATKESEHMEKGVSFCVKDYENLNDRYHTYAAEWEYDQIRLYIDDMLYMALNLNSDGMKWGFGDNPHYLILNTSVRGPGEEKAYPETAKESFYYIDWVRCYKRRGEVTATEKLPCEAAKPDYVNGAATEWLNRVCVSSDGKYTAAAGQDCNVYVYNQKKDKLLHKLTDSKVAIEAISFSPDGEKLCVPNRDGEIFIYDCADFTAEPIKVENKGTFHEFITFTPAGNVFFAGGRDTAERGRDGRKDSRVLRCWTLDGREAGAAEVESDVRSVAVSADGKYVAAVCSNGSMKLFGLPKLEELYSFSNEMGAAMRGVDFSADGLLAFSDEAGVIYFLDTKTKRVRTANKVNPCSVRRVKFSPDGRNLAAVCADNNARLFDSATGELSALLGGFDELVSDIEFKDDGSVIAVSSYDGTVRLFDDDGALVSAYGIENPLGRWVMDVALSADGERLFGVMGVRNTDYCVWDIK